jgi:hypothetical protein
MIKRFFAAVLVAAVFLNFSTHAASASYKHWLANMKAADQARTKRDFQKMREILEGSVEEARQIGPLSSGDTAYALSGALLELKDYQEGLDVLNGELERIGPKPGTAKLQVIRGLLLDARSEFYLIIGDYDNALTSGKEAKAILEDIAGKYHSQLFALHERIAKILRAKNNLAEAEKEYLSALKLAEGRDVRAQTEWSGSEQEVVWYRSPPLSQGIVRVCSELGELYISEQKYSDAEALFKKAIKTAEAAYGKTAPILVLPLEGMARVDRKMGRRKELEKDADRVCEVATKTPGLAMWWIDPLWVANPIWFEFELEFAENNPNTAQTARKITKVFEAQSFDPRSFARRALAMAVTNDQVDWKKADALRAIATKASADQWSASSVKHGQTLIEIASFATQFNNQPMATAAYEELANAQRSAPDKTLLISALAKIAEGKIADNKKADALPLYHEVTTAMRQKYGEDSRTATAMEKEAALMRELGNEAGAKELETEAREVQKRAILK